MKSIIISSLATASLMFLLSGCYGTTTSTTSGVKSAKCGDGKCGASPTKATKCGASKCGTSK